MASKKKTGLAFRLTLGEEGAKREVAPKKPTPSRPNVENVGVRPTYGLVFDPTGQRSDIFTAEQQAARDLYFRRMGEAAVENASARDVLDSAGFLNPAARRVKGQKPSKENPIFASASDAIDWLDRHPLSVVSPVIESYRAIPEGIRKEFKSRLTSGLEPPEYVKENYKSIAEGISAATHTIAPLISNAPFSAVGTLGLPGTPRIEPGTIKGKSGKPVTYGEVQAKIEDVAANPGQYVAPATKHPEGVPSRNPQITAGLDAASENRSVSEIKQILGPEATLSSVDDLRLYQWAMNEGWPKDKAEWSLLTPEEKLFRASNSNNFLATTARNAVKFVATQAALPAGIVAISDAAAQALGGDATQAELILRTAIEPYKRFVDTADKRGVWAASAEFMRENPGEFLLAVNVALKASSRAAGAAGRVVAPRVVPVAERVVAPSVGRVSETAASGVRQAAPRVAEAISAVSYPFREVTARGPVVGTAPLAPILPRVEGGWRGPWTPTPASDIAALRRGTELWKEYERAIDDYARTGEPTFVSTPIRVGYTGSGLFANAYLEFVKRRLVEGVPSIRSRFLRNQAGARPTRLIGNIGQGIRLDIGQELERALSEVEGAKVFRQRPVDRLTKERAAFDLSRPVVRENGDPYTPGFEASAFERDAGVLQKALDDYQSGAIDRSALDELLTQMDLVRLSKREASLWTVKDISEQVKYWQSYSQFLRKLDEVEIPDSVMARLREVAKGYGRENDRIVADLIGVSVEEARRKNYIRPVIVERERFASVAESRKRVQNTRLAVLSRSQARIQSLSKRIAKYADETGWGKYGAKTSVLKYESARRSLVKELKRAIRLAEKTGELELAATYRKALSDLSIARGKAAVDAVAMSRMLDNLERGELTPAQLEALTPEQQGLYTEATAALRESARLEREVVRPALSELGVASMKGVTRRSVELNRLRLSDAQQKLDEALQYEASGDPSIVARIEKLRGDVQREADALSLREAVLSSKEAIAAQRQIHRANVRLLRKEFDAGKPVFQARDIRVTLDVAKQFATVEAKRVREMNYYTIARAANETLDEYIARLEMNDQSVALHLMSRMDRENVGYVSTFEGDRALRADALMFSRAGRLVESTGYTFSRGFESPNMWRNLLFDTSELISAERMSQMLEQVVLANGTRFRFSPIAVARAKEMANTGSWSRLADGSEDVDAVKLYEDYGLLPSGVVRQLAEDESQAHATLVALTKLIESQGVEFQMNEFAIVALRSTKAKRPKESFAKGAFEITEPEYLNDLLWQRLTPKTIDPDVEYVLIPRSMFRGIQESLRDESFRLKKPQGKNWAQTNLGSYGLDRVTRAWRTVTLNILPRTAFVNIAGSSILALEGGASPYAMMLAFKAIHGIPHNGRILPVPLELRQRYYEQLFSDPRLKKLTREEIMGLEPSMAQSGLAWGAYWMNSIRYLNGMSEDLGRLAIWYQKAYPEAIRSAEGVRFFASARRLTNDAIDALESMARNDPKWQAKTQAWSQQAFDFLGDLHKGGSFASRMRIFFPFYQWYKHMVKLQLLTMPLKYPGRALFFQMIADIGEEYQREHGGLVPWGLDWVPIPGMDFVDRTLGGPQAVFIGLSSGNVYPQSTISQFATRDGDLRLYKAAQDTLNPLLSNGGMILAGVVSALSGAPVPELSPFGLTTSAKDEFGLPIESSLSSRVFWEYIANRMFRMFPLSPTIMGMGGQASNSIPFDRAEKPIDPSQLRYQDQFKGDVATLIEDAFDGKFGPAVKNLAAIFVRASVGLSMTAYYGSGPMRDKRFQDDFAYFVRKKSAEDNAIRKAFEQIHGIAQ